MKQKYGLVVGLGSVGKMHAKALSKYVEKLIIIDLDINNKKWASENISNVHSFHLNINDLKINEADAKVSVAIISTWGPDHFASFKFLVGRKFNRIICEKPLANSIYRGKQMMKIAEKNDVRLLYGITRRYTGFAKSIDKIFKSYCGDEVLFISITGGAQCAITTGIHWFDLATELINESPLEVFATLKDSEINPRNSDLGFWEGVITWKFRNSKFVNMVYSNSSFGRTKIQIYGKNGYLLLDPAKNIDIFGIDPSSQYSSSTITRTVDFDFIKSVNLSDFNLPNPFERQIEVLIGAEPLNYNLADILNTFNSFLSALISNERKKPITLPLKALNPYYYKVWPVS